MQAANNQQFGTLSQFFPLLHFKNDPSPEASQELRPYRVSILEGNASLARLLATGFSADSIRVTIHEDLDAALQHMENDASNLFILDLDLAGANGRAVLEQLRAMQPCMRLLVLSQRPAGDWAVEALNHGADDYLVKPFSLVEMMARIRALRRRSEEVTQAPALPVGKLLLHKDQCRVTYQGRSVDLTPRECDLLDFMMAHPGTALSRATLSQRVWNMPAEANTNIVDVYVKYLRDKLETAYDQKLIRTVRGVGYKFQHQS